MLRIVPASKLCLVTPVPFFLCPKHRLLVRGAHHNTIFISQPGIFRVIFVEGIVPHGRPKIIAFKPEDQLKEFLIKLMVIIGNSQRNRRIFTGCDRTEFFNYPPGQSRVFIIQKNAPVFHCRRPLYF